MDPSIKKDNFSNLIEPELPTALTVNSAKITFASLSEDEKEELKLLYFKYKHDLAKYERQEIALTNLRGFIQNMIFRMNFIYTHGCNSAYKMLLILKTRVTPTDKARKIELVNHY